MYVSRYQDVSEVLVVAFILGFFWPRARRLLSQFLKVPFATNNSPPFKGSQTFHSINVDKSTRCRLIAAPFIDGRDRHDRAPFLEFMARRFYVDLVREELLPVV
jgi:hypothetical protein